MRVQQRDLGLAPEGTPTLTGGWPSPGTLQQLRLPGHRHHGPCTAQAATTSDWSPPSAACCPSPAWHLVLHPTHLADPLLIADLGEEAARQTAVLPVATSDDANGPATVASYTVTFDPGDPLRASRVAIVADLADGRRAAATCEDAAFAQRSLTESLIGQSVNVTRTTFTL